MGEIAVCGYDITSNRSNVQSHQMDDKKTPRTVEEYEEQEAAEIEKLGSMGSGVENRKTPQYSMNYQQAVTAEDVFLQMGLKTPSSASCENLIVSIMMPRDKKENVELKVDTKSVTVMSSQFFLQLPLPHEIDPDNSKAIWDSEKETLVLTLKLEREFDFVNF
ncbi:dynein axonemal assembly factor 6 isoform X1 [Battus philenor]|uniref:dynein axonemal assembly factor 6 isoform X1 n=1 Tax=Battus philenor TaxID=42288 RepID=UPI0035CEB763